MDAPMRRNQRKDPLYRIYRVWDGMKQRCFNERHSKYRIYGARGITVCDAWRNSFETFIADMGPRPDGYSLERIDNNGNYEPGNCKWATPLEQAHNRRSCVAPQHNKIEWNGQRLTFADAGRLVGLPWAMISKRIKRGWSVEAALTTPARSRNPAP